MTLVNRALRTPLALLLATTATLAGMASAHAGTRLDLAASRYTETADGALLLNAEPVRLSHQPALVASDCIAVEAASGRASGGRTMLVNRCAHAVEVSYCLVADEVRSLRCEDIGRRGFASVAIAAHGRVPVATATPIGADLQWVACQAGDHRYSTLIDNGTRGECLVAEGPTALAGRGD